MSTTTLTNINDVFGQAQDGSVAAIIQILNERLIDSGIRTRAVFVENVLQLLCEAPTPEQLKKTVVVEHIRDILEDISPRRIRWVNINSRLVREQQLLWLEEISRDPDKCLLWSEKIALKQPHFFRRMARDLRRPKFHGDMPEGASKSDLRQRKSFFNGIVGGLSVGLLLLGIGIWAYRQRAAAIANQALPTASTPAQPNDDSVQATEEPPGQLPLPESYDPFARAVRLAEQSAATGKIAETPAQWIELAARWQQASDLMAEVPNTDERYQIAQDRVAAYKANSDALLKKVSTP